MPNVDVLFEGQLIKKNINFEKKDKNLYLIHTNGTAKTISLQNLEKNFIRDQDINAVDIFIASIMQPIENLPKWSELKKGVFVSLEPSNYDNLDQEIHKKLSKSAVAILSYYSHDTNQVRWLRKADLIERNVNVEKVWNQAYDNLEEILAKSEINFTDIDGEKLGMLEVHEPYKASLILAKGLKSKVSKYIGWPIYAVAPARDFVYIFSKEGGLINKVGAVVTKEYSQSGYPISTEVWELSDSMQKTIGAFPVEQ